MNAAAVAWLAAWGAVSLWATLRPRPRVRDRATPPLRVVVVRPCEGAPEVLERALASAARVRSRHALEVIHAAPSDDDPAFAVARRVSEELRAQGVDARTTITSPRGANRKAAQIASALEGVSADVIVVADADVALDEESLDALVAPIASDPVVGAAWAPPVESAAPRTVADRASQALLAGSLHAFAMLAALDGRGMVGKLAAVRATSLARVGGFGALGEYLGEDMELARRLFAAGERVVAVRRPAVSLASGRSARDVIGRYSRWIAVIREQRPLLLASYPLLFGAAPLLVALALATGAPAWALAIAVARVSLALVARARSGFRPSLAVAAIDALLADPLLLAAFIVAVARRDVRWNGRRLRFAGGGRLAREGGGEP